VDEPNGSETDALLVTRAKTGDRDSFERLVRRHLRVAHAVALRSSATRADADDVVQDAFLRALERLEDCRQPDRFRAWLLTIVRNRAHNVRGREMVRSTETLDDLHPVAGGEDPSRRAEAAEFRAELDTAMGTLTELQRSVFVAHDMEGLDHAEVADRLGISRSSSRFNLHVARKALRERLPGTLREDWGST
jgi:RNA polymerase sigma-70 factor (ECF subfamily)